MVVFKRRQVVILALVLMIIVAGYLQYSYSRRGSSVADKETGKLGEAVYVGSNDAKPVDKDADSKKAGTGDSKKTIDSKASKKASDYFSQAKLEKEAARSKDKESLKAITDDVNASKEAKDKAFEQLQKLVADGEKEMKIETLVKQKGFDDAVALFGDDNSIDVVVMAPSLTQADIVQISDIVSRQANVDMGNVHVKNYY